MPVRKFRTVEEMKTVHWRQPGDPALARAMAALWDVGRHTSRRLFPPGVHKHASLGEMQRVQEARTARDPRAK
jgi:hypothetical protein